MKSVEDFVKALQINRRRLFHFTDSRNITSITANGLLPTAEIRRRKISCRTGGDDDSLRIDAQKGFDEYVRLSFCRNHPMCHVAKERGNIEKVRKLTVCPSVLLREGVLVADRVATANDVVLGNVMEMIPKMDIEATYKFLDWKNPDEYARRLSAEKWEVMIPGVIDPKYISGL